MAWLFREDDAAAARHGWQIEAGPGSRSRVYRDPRFDRFTRCAACGGTGQSAPSAGAPVRGPRPALKPTDGSAEMTTKSPPRAYATRRAMAGLELAVSTVARANPLVIAWRWRYEIGLGVLVRALAVIGLNFAVGLWWGLATIVTASCLTAASRPLGSTSSSAPGASSHHTGCGPVARRRGFIRAEARSPSSSARRPSPSASGCTYGAGRESPRKIWLRPVRYWPRLAGPRLSMSPA